MAPDKRRCSRAWRNQSRLDGPGGPGLPTSQPRPGWHNAGYTACPRIMDSQRATRLLAKFRPDRIVEPFEVGNVISLNARRGGHAGSTRFQPAPPTKVAELVVCNTRASESESTTGCLQVPRCCKTLNMFVCRFGFIACQSCWLATQSKPTNQLNVPCADGVTVACFVAEPLVVLLLSIQVRPRQVGFSKPKVSSVPGAVQPTQSIPNYALNY